MQLKIPGKSFLNPNLELLLHSRLKTKLSRNFQFHRPDPTSNIERINEVSNCQLAAENCQRHFDTCVSIKGNLENVGESKEIMRHLDTS